jgi:hypothetical protein
MTTMDTPPVYNSGPRTWVLILAAVVIALVAGAGGAGLDHAAFPAKNGAVGARGPAGPQGPIGLTGAPGAAASSSQVSVDTDKLGYCFETQTANDSALDLYYVNDVSLFPPTDDNGVLSCGSGSFVSLTPNLPSGSPATGYDPTTSAP